MNTIYSLIHRNLRRTLLVSLSAAGSVLLVYSVLSFKQTELQAVDFVANHVAALAQAGVNSQNINEIDKEIGRFVQTWKETQDLDLRVDIFLNDRLVAHGGQLQSFRYFRSNVERRLTLLSGEELRIKIEIGLLNFIISGLLLLGVFAFFIFCIFYVLMRSMKTSIKNITSPLESRIEWLKQVANDLPNSAHDKSAVASKSEVQEIDELGTSISTLLGQIVLLESRLSKTNFDRGRIKMADQVAHSIKGVIGTLQLKIGAVKSLSDFEKRELAECLNSLRDVSQNLLKKQDEETQILSPQPMAEPLHLFPVVTSVVSAKQNQFRDRKEVRIEFDQASGFGLFCGLSSGDLQTVVVNLIDNGIDAVGARGKVAVRMFASNGTVQLLIEDNGVGIPAHILPLLTQDGATFGKKNGNGIGLAHIKEILTKAGGEIAISSTEGKGTIVRVTLPLIARPNGFLDKIEISEDATLVIVDDDSLVPAVWRQRLAMTQVGVKKVVNISSPSEFRDWIEKNGQANLGERFYAFDYDLKAEMSGLDLIEEYGLAFESIVISGLADTTEVRSRCARLGLSWLSKENLGIVPLSNSGRTLNEASLPGAV